MNKKDEDEKMIILVGASASGKTEVAKELNAKYGMKKVVTHTTRKKREHEIDDVDYHFVDVPTFLSLKEKSTFVETTQYNENYYGTSKSEIGDNKCLIVDPNGMHAFQALNDSHIVTFLLIASKETRKKRMQLRGDDSLSIEKRLENDENSFSMDKIGKVDFVIDTEKLSIEEISSIIMKNYREKLSSLESIN